ncbi:MAG: hypothetical protein RIF32_01080 [Leptospirales bacterium]
MNLRVPSIAIRSIAPSLLAASILIVGGPTAALLAQVPADPGDQTEVRTEAGLFDSDETSDDELLFDPGAAAQLPPGSQNDISSGAAGDSESFILAQADGQAGQLGNSPLNGFADAPWGSTYTEVRTRLKNLATSATAIERVEILNEERNRFILVKRNDVLYRYSFYKTPYNVALLQNHNLTTEEHDEIESRLYHVKVSTPFILSQYVKDKLAVIYGLNARSTVNDEKKGADIWEPDGGLIFQWYEPYRGKAFTRTVDYLSLDLAKEIMTEYADYFDAREKLILQKILLQ